MTKVKISSKKLLIASVIVILLALATIPSYYFYDKYQKSQQLLKNPTEAARVEVKTLVERVGNHIELPNEEPTIATVSDKEKLKEQAFFQKAENGDKVLIYTQTRKAILFRPSANKIIEVSTVNLGQAPPEAMPAAKGVAGDAASSGSVKEKPTVMLLNGTNTIGITKTIEKQLMEKGVNIQVVAKENAKKQDYAKTVVVDLTGNQKVIVQGLASILDGEISSLPEGEDKPEADILIILGSDLK